MSESFQRATTALEAVVSCSRPLAVFQDLDAGPQIFAKSFLGGAPYQKEKNNKAQSNQSLKVKYLEIHPIFYN